MKVIKTFGTSHFYSADVFNELEPISDDLNYLKSINQAVLESINQVDPEGIWYVIEHDLKT